ncbi:MAG: efflux RND transporter permease subunit [Bacteroidota bacterium]
MNIPKLAIKNYHIVCTVFLMLLVASWLNFTTTARTEFPIIDVPTVAVVAVVAGADVENMETHFLTPMEEALGALADVEDIRSHISGNVINVQISFEYGVDMDKKLNQAQSMLNFIRKDLPQDLVDLQVNKASTNFTSILNLAILPQAVPFDRAVQEAKNVQKIIRLAAS